MGVCFDGWEEKARRGGLEKNKKRGKKVPFSKPSKRGHTTERKRKAKEGENFWNPGVKKEKGTHWGSVDNRFRRREAAVQKKGGKRG